MCFLPKPWAADTALDPLNIHDYPRVNFHDEFRFG